MTMFDDDVIEEFDYEHELVDTSTYEGNHGRDNLLGNVYGDWCFTTNPRAAGEPEFVLNGTYEQARDFAVREADGVVLHVMP